MALKIKDPKQRRRLMIAGGVGVVVLLILMLRRSSSSASTATTPASTDPSIDPATGVPYSQEFASPSGGGGSGLYSDPGATAPAPVYGGPSSGGSGYGTGDTSGAAPGDTGTGTPSSPSSSPTAPTAPPTAPQAPPAGLSWGGRVFSSWAAFGSWLTARGGTISQFVAAHPVAAYQLNAVDAGGLAALARTGKPSLNPNLPNIDTVPSKQAPTSTATKPSSPSVPPSYAAHPTAPAPAPAPAYVAQRTPPPAEHKAVARYQAAKVERTPV